MKLYNKKLRPLLKHFPKEVLGSETKESNYTTSKSFYALQSYKFIQYNSKDLINILAVDIDSHQDGGVWIDHHLPQPTWTIFTDRGVQFMWILEKPILAHVRSHKSYAKDTLLKIVYALGADTSAIGFNRVFRNPLTNSTHFSNNRVSLKDFDALSSPPVEWLHKINPHNIPQAEPKESGFKDMREGDGRNVALFNRLRFWAYKRAKEGNYTEFSLAQKAYMLNQTFSQMMSDKEVERIISSIDQFIENTYTRSNYMAKTTPEERSKIASKNGAKGGAVTAKIRKTEARGRILAELNRLEAFEMKITISGVAKQAKSDKTTVSTYFKELGYTNQGGSTGWKKSKATKGG